LHDARRADSDGDKANMLNSFFYSCFRQSHPPVAECYPPYFSCPDDVLCSEQEVCDLLAALNVTKASGQDGISARMLRYIKYYLLTHTNVQSVIEIRHHSIRLETIPDYSNTQEF